MRFSYYLFMAAFLPLIALEAARPNIVLVMCDDLGWGDPAGAGPDSLLKTPSLDRIAAEGVRCTDVHSPSSVCTPTRYGLLTGRYASPDDVPDGLSRSRLFSDDRPLSKHGEEGCEVEAFEAMERVRHVADGLGESMAAVAFSWVRQQAGVTSLLVGSRSPEELALNLPSLDVHLEDDVIHILNEATQPVKDHLGANADMWISPSRMR